MARFCILDGGAKILHPLNDRVELSDFLRRVQRRATGKITCSDSASQKGCHHDEEKPDLAKRLLDLCWMRIHAA